MPLGIQVEIPPGLPVSLSGLISRAWGLDRATDGNAGDAGTPNYGEKGQEPGKDCLESTFMSYLQQNFKEKKFLFWDILKWKLLHVAFFQQSQSAWSYASQPRGNRTGLTLTHMYQG